MLMYMKITIFHYLKEDYTVSHSVMLNFRMFYLMKDYLKELGYEIHFVKEFIKNKDDLHKINNKDENYKLADSEFDRIFLDASKEFLQQVKNTTDYDNSMIIGFHPKGFMWLYRNSAYPLLKMRGIKLINWHDDLHSYPKSRKLPIETIVKDETLDGADLILTPSKLYWTNIKSQYIDKSVFYFYCFNENYYLDLPINNFKKRKNKILLSGAIYVGYDTRTDLYRCYNRGDALGKYIDHLPHPTYDRNKNTGKTGLDYYKLLASYKGAFFGFYKYPLNYPLAKVIEILACGTLGFFEYSPILGTLGLEKFKHYVPLLVDSAGKIIIDANYYVKYLNSEEGEKIASQGCQYVRNKFTMRNKCVEFDNIIKAAF